MLKPKGPLQLIDLRDSRVRRLWDAEDGALVVPAPDRLLLNGFSYDSLHEPLDAKGRLGWIAASQRDGHHPGVYLELANAFQRVGQRADARTVSIASERRARHGLSRLSPRGLWSDLLWVTVAYGYRNWLAGCWLLTVLFSGALFFTLDQGSFTAKSFGHGHFSPVLYALDITIPFLDLGQVSAWSAEGAVAWVGVVMAISGYALAAAVIAAAAGVFKREQG